MKSMEMQSIVEEIKFQLKGSSNGTRDHVGTQAVAIKVCTYGSYKEFESAMGSVHM